MKFTYPIVVALLALGYVSAQSGLYTDGSPDSVANVPQKNCISQEELITEADTLIEKYALLSNDEKVETMQNLGETCPLTLSGSTGVSILERRAPNGCSVGKVVAATVLTGIQCAVLYWLLSFPVASTCVKDPTSVACKIQDTYYPWVAKLVEEYYARNL
ncbi:hypothetical protein IWQ60_002948 [Tieghemiomyces parasiticus]|uniref:Uncharacterized protein n=1 Tax=Tieghemiomyces parasiticus TaxID=78921 RepID=A0A9W8ABQ4_9FUNG|nr:hypothetical protein IWQ60_002948 [Tieghemiomyces parasiticus]